MGQEKDSDDNIGLIMNYSYADIQTQEHAAFVVEAVLRAPLGLIEPDIATGPGYLLALSDDMPASGACNGTYNFRAGFDINITDWLSGGPGITLLIANVRQFFENIETMDI